MFALALAVAIASSPAPAHCSYDRDRLLALDEYAFDQDLEGGWRALAQDRQCQLAAADLIRDYRNAHAHYSTGLLWHEGQLRAVAGQADAAVALFDKAHATEPGHADWDLYVDGSIAFLKRDRAALQSARDKLAALPRPADFSAVDEHGKRLPVEWPPNLSVLDGLLACFDRPYSEGYGTECRKPMKVEVK